MEQRRLGRALSGVAGVDVAGLAGGDLADLGLADLGLADPALAGLDLQRRPDPALAVAWLLARAASSGDTVVPAGLIRRAVAGMLQRVPGDPAVQRAVDAVLEAGHVLIAPDPDTGRDRLALVSIAALEETVAEHVGRLLVTAEGDVPGVGIVLDLPGARLPDDDDANGDWDRSDDGEDRGGDGGRTAVLRSADRLSLRDVARMLAAVPDGGRVVLVGDPERLPAPGPGRFLADLVASGEVPVHTPVCEPDRPLHRLAASVRAGQLPATDAADREVVVVPVTDHLLALRRAVQLVSDSVPRTFGLAPADVLVLTPLRRGAAGANRLAEALQETGARVATVHEAAGEEAAAVVLVLPGESAGTLHRAMLLSAVTRAGRHLSVVQGAGEALATAVARGPRRRPRTRLAELLASGG